MKLGILLLNKNNVYLTSENKLPKSPSWDKKFLKNLIKGKRVVCSRNTLLNLPKAITDIAYFTTNTNMEYDINFGIDTFKDKVDLLLVVRGKGEEEGKQFNLDDYNLILSKGGLELWTLK
jgi:hypothetical protein